MNQLANLSKQAYSSGVLQTLFSYYEQYSVSTVKDVEVLKRVKALYNQLQDKTWFDKYMSMISLELNNLK